jgi:hypothetical protein
MPGREIRLLAAGFLLALLSSFGQTFFIALFGAQIRTEFGLTHGASGACTRSRRWPVAVACSGSGRRWTAFGLLTYAVIASALLAGACLLLALSGSTPLLVLRC